MSAIYLPRRWLHQPQTPVDLDQARVGERSQLLLPGVYGLTFRGQGVASTTLQYQYKHTSTVQRLTSQGLRMVGDLGGSNDDRLYATDRLPWWSPVDAPTTCVVVASTLPGQSAQAHLLAYPVDSTDRSAAIRVQVTAGRALNVGYSAGNGYDYFKSTSSTDWNDASTHGKPFAAVVSIDPRSLSASIAVARVGALAQFASTTGSLSFIDDVAYADGRTVFGTNNYPDYYGWNGLVHGLALYNRFIEQDEAEEIARFPWSIYRPKRARIWFDVGAGGGGGTFQIYGDLAATEGADTATIAGAVAITGSLAATESADTAAIAGMLLVTGTLSATEGADTASLAGAVAITGTLVATESADTASINAGTGVNGSLAAAESADTFAASGAVAVTGTLAAAESADTAEVSGAVGSVGITGTFAATEAADTAEVTGTVPIIGTLAATEAADTALLNGGSGVFGSVAVTEAADTAEMAGTVGAAAITGTLAATESEDIASVAGTVPVLGSFDILEVPDTFAAAGQILVTGTLAATEGADTASFSTLAQLAAAIAHTRRIGSRKTIFSAGRLGARRTYFAGRRIGPRRIQGD